MPLYEGLSSLGLIDDKHTTVVFDFGTAYTKLGFAGECGPRAVVRSEVVCRKTGKLVPVFEFENEEELRHHLIDFIYHLYFKHLLVNSKDRRVVVIENILGSSVIKNVLASVLFRYYEVQSLLFVPSQLVALMTLGINTAIVIDIGYKETSVLPVFEGIPVLHAWQSLPLASEAIHKCLEELLLDRALSRGPDGSERRLAGVMTSIPEVILEDIKVRCCFVTTVERSERVQTNKYDRSHEPPPPPPSVEYPVKGEEILTIPGTVREMAAELLFEEDRDCLSLPSMVLNVILKCPVDMRRALADNLVIMGGTSNLLGLKHRLLAEVRSQSHQPPYSEKTKVTAFRVHVPPAKDNCVSWLGGAILGCTEAVVFRSLSRDRYLHSGMVPDWSNLSFNVVEEREEKTA